MAPTIPSSLPAAFLRAVQTDPEKTFVHFEGRRVTYAEAHGAISAVAGSLREMGARRGDRIALYLENSLDFIEMYLGALWLGAIVVPVNTRYRSTELSHILDDSSPRLLVADAAGAEEAERVLVDAPRTGLLMVGGGRAPGASTAPPLLDPVQLGPDDPAVIGYTSGTTGRSKGAVMSHGNFCSNSVAVTTAWEWTADDHLLLVLPLFHTHGLAVGLHGTIIQGSSITLHRGFDAAAVLNELSSGSITMFFGVPTMYSRLVAEAARTPARPRGIRLFVSGSAPLSPQLLADVEATFGQRILERYGMTETVMNLGNPLEGERKPGSVGVPFQGIEVRIAHPRSNERLATGELGEVQLRGPNISSGYWQNEAATAEVWTQDGWFKTGDLGFQDEDGYVFLTGRARELIISGGFNVYPREVEEVLEQHPAVAQAAVLGMPDPDFGEKVVAAVVLRSPVEAGELQDFCRERLASFKKPREVHPVEALPRNAMGKVQKHLLKELLLESV